MGRTVKFKLSVSILAVSLLVLIPLYKSNFNSPITIKRWGALTWNDFQGLVRPFAYYDAAISSNVYLEYDSLTSQFHAYAGQHNIYSWVKKSTLDSDYSLNHEQYHFNITELHARLMNEYIKNNSEETASHYRYQLASIRGELDFMQDEYDYETSHSQIIDKQRRWEYKIDSLLVLHSSDSGWVTDFYSGAKVYLPYKPEFTNGILESSNGVYRIYTLYKYGMTFSLTSFRYKSFDVEGFDQNLYSFYEKNSMEIKSFIMDSTRYEFEAMVISKDSISTNYSLWIHQSPFTYQVKAVFSNTNKIDSTGYIKNAISFIKSFKISNTDSYWLNKFDNSNAIITVDDISRNTDHESHKFSYCLTYRDEEQNGFYHGPIYRDDGSLLLAFDNIRHEDSLLHKNILILNNDLYTYEPDSADQVFFIPADKLPKGKMNLAFGYLLTEDSVKKCYDYYYQSLKVDSPIDH